MDADRYLPPFTYKAALVGAGLSPNSMPVGSNVNGILRYDLVGPEIMFPRVGVTDSMQAEFYRGEAVVAGSVGSPFGLPGRGWQGDSQHFYESSLDLKAITGIADLGDNISPIGLI